MFKRPTDLASYYDRVKTVVANRDDFDSFCAPIRQWYPTGFPGTAKQLCTSIARELYRAEHFSPDVIPAPPADQRYARGGAYEDYLEDLVRKVMNPQTKATLASYLVRVFDLFFTANPAPPTSSVTGAITLEVATTTDTSKLAGLIERISAPFQSEEAKTLGIATALRNQLEANLFAASNLARPELYVERRKFNTGRLVPPAKYQGDDPVHAYLHDTPLRHLFETTTTTSLTDDVRFEHHWLVAGTGHGKTQTLQYMIAQDLQRVERGEASIVVLDSQGDLIRKLSRLRTFLPGEPLADRLVYIDPDPDHPPALNLFDLSSKSGTTLSAREEQAQQTAVSDMYKYIFGALLGMELTGKMSTPFEFVAQLMTRIPDATIKTFMEVMREDGENLPEVRTAIDQLDGIAYEFFTNEFADTQRGDFRQTRKQVISRLYGVLKNRTFEQMFSHPENRLDLDAELNAGKVILINADQNLLGRETVPIFGRFFIARLLLAAHRRSEIPEHLRKPTFIYIDEAWQYLDSTVAEILFQARKYKMGMILAMQSLKQLETQGQHRSLAGALDTSTTIKMAGGVPTEAQQFATMMFSKADYIGRQPKLSFATFVKNVTPTAVSFSVTPGVVERLPKITEREFETKILPGQRAKYCAPPLPARPRTPPPPITSPTQPAPPTSAPVASPVPAQPQLQAATPPAPKKRKRKRKKTAPSTSNPNTLADYKPPQTSFGTDEDET